MDSLRELPRRLPVIPSCEVSRTELQKIGST